MCSEHPVRALQLAPGWLCFLLLAMISSAWGHPELLLQIEQLDSEIAAQPASAKLLVQRGDLYRRDGNYVAAWRDFNEAHQLDPGFNEYNFYSGRLALEMGDPQTALLQLGQYLQQNPGHAAAWVLHGNAQMALGNPLAAAEDYGKSITTSTSPTPTLYLQQAQAFNSAGPDHQATALQVIDQGLQRFPLEVSLLGLGTDIALELNQTEKAQTYIDSLPEPIQQLPQWKERRARLKRVQ